MTMRFVCLLIHVILICEIQTDDITDSVQEAVRLVDGGRFIRSVSNHENSLTNITIDGRVKRNALANSPEYMYGLFNKQREDPVMVDAMARSAAIAETASVILAKKRKTTVSGLKSYATSVKFEKAMTPNCAVHQIECDPTSRYRTIDGTCNNLQNPFWGAAITQQPRFAPADYGDSLNSGITPGRLGFRGSALPNPRDLSNMIHNGGQSPRRSCLHNVLFTHFGQFIDHDIISTPVRRAKKGKPEIKCCQGNDAVHRPECFAINTRKGDFLSTCMEFVRSESAPTSACSPGERNQMNQITSYLDLSATYGSSKKTRDELTDFNTGKLKSGPGGLLPNGKEGCLTGSLCFQSGDSRHTEVPQLNAIHTLFLREHNRIVDIFKKMNPHWDANRLYQEARKLVIGVYQHIVYNEFLPIVLGHHGMKYYGLNPSGVHNTQYNIHANAGTRNAFGAAAFRIGHSWVGSLVGSTDKYFRGVKTTPLEGEFFNPRTIRDNVNYGVDGLSRWMLNQFASGADRFLTPSLRNSLFQTKRGNGFDLSALNIQRGRDHGLPSYNTFRKYCGLRPALNFYSGYMGLTSHDRYAAHALSKIYKHPDDIDLFVGGFSEQPIQGTLVGPTFRCLIGMQFKMYKTGDRFFYENNLRYTGFTTSQLFAIKSQTMSSLYCRNFDIPYIQGKGFLSPQRGCNYRASLERCSSVPRLGEYELRAWKEITRYSGQRRYGR